MKKIVQICNDENRLVMLDSDGNLWTTLTNSPITHFEPVLNVEEFNRFASQYVKERCDG